MENSTYNKIDDYLARVNDICNKLMNNNENVINKEENDQMLKRAEECLLKAREMLNSDNDAGQITPIIRAHHRLFQLYLHSNVEQSDICATCLIELCDSNEMLGDIKLELLESIIGAYRSQNQYNLAEKHAKYLCQLLEDKDKQSGELALNLQILAEIYMDQYKCSDALPTLQKLKTIITSIEDFDDIIPDVMYQIGKCFNFLGQHKLAESELNNTVKLLKQIEGSNDFDPLVYAHTIVELGKLYTLQNLFDNAEKLYIEAIQIYKKLSSIPDEINVAYLLAFIDHMRCDYSRGVKRIRDLLEYLESNGIKYDEDTKIYYLLGKLTFSDQKFSEAVKYFLKTIELKKNDSSPTAINLVEARCRLGEAYRRLGEYDKAIEVFKVNDELYNQSGNSVNINGFYGLACSLLDKGESLSNYKIDERIKNHKNMAKLYPSVFNMLEESSVSYHEDFVYPMTRKSRGICFVINNLVFHKFDQWRSGSNLDAIRLIRLFYNFNFKVVVKNDMQANEIITELEKIAESDSLSSHDAFILIILSHGNNGRIYGVDDEIIETSEIFQIFSNLNCPNLVGKPKIFIFQCCRGHKAGKYVQITTKNDKIFCNSDINATSTTEKDTETSELVVPILSDIFAWYSTIEGYVSYRDPIRGSLFVEVLVEIIEQRAHDTKLVDITKLVERTMKTISADDCIQTTSSALIGWSKDFYFMRDNDSNKNVKISSDVFHILITLPDASRRQTSMELDCKLKRIYHFVSDRLKYDLEDFDIVMVRTRKRLSDYTPEDSLIEIGFQQQEILHVQFKY